MLRGSTIVKRIPVTPSVVIQAGKRVFKKLKDGSYTPTTINLKAIAQNVKEPIYEWGKLQDGVYTAIRTWKGKQSIDVTPAQAGVIMVKVSGDNLDTPVSDYIELSVVEDGTDGVNGKNGCIPRTYQDGYVIGRQYRNDINLDTTAAKYIDYIAVPNSKKKSGYDVYQCAETHIGSSDRGPGTKYWNKVALENEFAFFTYLLAKNANIQMLSGSQYTILDENNNIVGTFKAGDFPLAIGATTDDASPFKVDKKGKMYSKGAAISGFVTREKTLITPDNVSQYTTYSDLTESNIIDFYKTGNYIEFSGDFSSVTVALLLYFPSAVNDNVEAIKYLGSTVSIFNKSQDRIYISGLLLQTESGTPQSFVIAPNEYIHAECKVRNNEEYYWLYKKGTIN